MTSPRESAKAAIVSAAAYAAGRLPAATPAARPSSSAISPASPEVSGWPRAQTEGRQGGGAAGGRGELGDPAGREHGREDQGQSRVEAHRLAGRVVDGRARRQEVSARIVVGRASGSRGVRPATLRPPGSGVSAAGRTGPRSPDVVGRLAGQDGAVNPNPRLTDDMPRPLETENEPSAPTSCAASVDEGGVKVAMIRPSGPSQRTCVGAAAAMIRRWRRRKRLASRLAACWGIGV